MPAAWHLLRKFVDVRRREVEPALVFFAFWFLSIVVFQVLKPLKKGLFVEQLGAYVELYAKLSNVGMAFVAVVGFTALYDRLGSRKLVRALCVFFGSTLLLFAVLWRRHDSSPFMSWSFYLFGDLWSTVWVTTFWAYLNEVTETEQSKRLYGLIGGGGVIGGLVGGLVVWRLVQPLGTPTLLVACAVATGVMGLLLWRIECIAKKPNAPIGRREAALQLPVFSTATKSTARMNRLERHLGPAFEGARIVAGSRYLLAIVATLLLYELTSQILDYQYSSKAQLLEGRAATQAFFGQITAIIGVISILTQFFLVSFVIRRFGMTPALLVLPMAMATASGVYMVFPVLWAGALLTISDNAFSYSINQTARETLFVPTSPDVKYKARAFGNMFVQRVGKALAIGMALGLSALPVRFLSVLAIAVALLWAAVAMYAGRRFDQMTVTGEQT